MKDYLSKVSHKYFAALEDSKKLQANTNKFSGKFIKPHAKYIKGIIDQYNIRSILDYGCGKGLQYEWVIPSDTPLAQWSLSGDLEREENIIPGGMTLEQYWGIKVTKFDPAVPKFAAEPEAAHDLVICSHVLGAIPVYDLPVIIKRLFSLANKFLYIVESIGLPKKKWVSEGIECPIGWTKMQWIEVIAPHKRPEVECEIAFKYRSESDYHLSRFRL